MSYKSSGYITKAFKYSCLTLILLTALVLTLVMLSMHLVQPVIAAWHAYKDVKPDVPM